VGTVYNISVEEDESYVADGAIVHNCQDISAANSGGAGLAGARSGLFFEFARLAGELRPTWLLVENVDNLLAKHSGEDFAVVLRTLGALGYFLEWRVLDSRYFGVPQRRNRVFLVGHLGGPPPFPVLFEPEGVQGHPAAGREAGAEVAGTLGGGSGGRGWCDDLDRAGDESPGPVEDVAFALRSSQSGSQGGAQGHNTTYVATAEPEVSRSLLGGGNDRHDVGLEILSVPVVASTLSTSAGTNGHYGGRHQEDDSSLMASTMGGDGVAHAVTAAKSYRLDGESETFVAAYGIQSNAWRPGKAKTPSADAEGRVRLRDPGLGIDPELAGTLQGGPIGVAAFDLAQITSNVNRNRVEPGLPMPPLNGSGQAGVTGLASVRRLTPLERERLQGFPDGWSCLCGCEPYSTHACKCKDGPRDQATGDAVTVPVVAWIGRRLLAAYEAENAS
jgi:DNA (cytosine-5)-methyltransferase 1